MQRDNHRRIKYISLVSRDTWELFAARGFSNVPKGIDGRADESSRLTEVPSRSILRKFHDGSFYVPLEIRQVSVSYGYRSTLCSHSPLLPRESFFLDRAP